MIQRTEEWCTDKLGKLGCSRLIDVLATVKSGESASRRNYMADLICERLTGKRAETFMSSDMLHGIETEPQARAAYEVLTGVFVEEHGGKEHEKIKGFRGSPDGLVGSVGGIEIKCPKTATHLDTLLNGTVKRDYVLQMAGYVAIYDRAWWDFVSYDPRLPERMAIFVKRFERKDLPVDEVEDGAKKFLAELEAKIKSLEALYG